MGRDEAAGGLAGNRSGRRTPAARRRYRRAIRVEIGVNTDKLDARDRERIRGQRCYRCGHANPELHHIVHRGRLGTRHDPENHLPLCRGCHAWVHANRKLYEDWLEREWPGRLETLKQRAGAYKPPVERPEARRVSQAAVSGTTGAQHGRLSDHSTPED